LVLYVLSIPITILAGGDLEAALLWPLFVVLGFFFFSLLFAPSWALGVYLAMSLRLLWRYPQPPRFRLIQLLAAFTWLAAFLAACRWAIVRSLQEYARLPVEQPGGCYVASAAAYGHATVVQSAEVVAADGMPVRVNRQLRILKAGELALRALAPGVHRRIRRGYDAIGPLAARCLANPYLADSAYLTLKPAEWVTHACLSCILGGERRRIDRLFLPHPVKTEKGAV
jgi:hypothetical protein